VSAPLNELSPPSALIIGGTGGIGGAIIEALVREGKFTVHGTTRQRLASSPEVTWHRLDITDESSVAQLAADLDRLDLVINTAGVLSNERFSPEKSVRQAGADQFLDQMRTNAMPLLLLGKHLGPLLKKSHHAHFITLSARVGSISDNHLGGWFSYRASKAALNMLVRTLAIEWQRTLPNTCLAAYHPGTVDTGLSKPFVSKPAAAKGRQPPVRDILSPAAAAAHLLALIPKLTPQHTGTFWDWRHDQISW
jgi:NAD(P)-dependent dehydrogenase (short-subunit alcohol dehydrogenase family)